MSRLTATLSPLGVVQVEALLARGPLFDVFGVSRGGRRYRVKTPTISGLDPIDWAPLYPEWSGDLVRSFVTGESSRGGVTARVTTPDADLARMLLIQEAEVSRRHAAAWFQGELLLGTWDLAARLVPGARRADCVLVTALQPGRPLSSLRPDEQRDAILRLLPELWIALSGAHHGRLGAASVWVSPTLSRFSLLDPGVVLDSDLSSGTRVDREVILSTRLASYPILPPSFEPPLRPGVTPPPAAPGLERLAQELARLAGPAQFGSGSVIGTLGHSSPGGDTADAPSLPDRIALGVMVYEIFAGQHPLFAPDFPDACWLGAFGERSRGREHLAAARERLARPVLPPSHFTPTLCAAEDALVMALIGLQVDDLAALRALVDPCLQEHRPEITSATLSWRDDEGRAQELTLGVGDVVLIGRGADALVRSASRIMSRRHAIIRFDGQAIVEDQASNLGTFLLRAASPGAPPQRAEREVLADRDVVICGSLRIEVRLVRRLDWN